MLFRVVVFIVFVYVSFFICFSGFVGCSMFLIYIVFCVGCCVFYVFVLCYVFGVSCVCFFICFSGFVGC